jgi:hypothetical protein
MVSGYKSGRCSTYWIVTHRPLPPHGLDPLSSSNWELLKIWNVQTDGRTPWTGDRLIARPVTTSTHRRTHSPRFDHEWFTEHSWANVPVHTSRSHRSLYIRVIGGPLMRNRKPTSNSSSLALGPNAEHSLREGEHTVYTSPLEVARRMFGDVWR